MKRIICILTCLSLCACAQTGTKPESVYVPQEKYDFTDTGSDVTFADKKSGDYLTPDNINELKEVTNTKVDQDEHDSKNATQDAAIALNTAKTSFPGFTSLLSDYGVDLSGKWDVPDNATVLNALSDSAGTLYYNGELISGTTELDALTDITDSGTTGNVLYDDGDGTFSFSAPPSGTVSLVQTVSSSGSTTSVPSEAAVGTALDLKQNTADVVEADVDDVTLQRTGTTSITLSVKDGGIGTTQLADGAVTAAKLATSVGGGSGVPITLSDAPYSNVACSGNGHFSNTFYLCIDGFYTQSIASTDYSNLPVPGSITISPLSWDPADADNSTASATQTFTLTAIDDTVVLSGIALTTGTYFSDAGTGTCTSSTSLTASGSCTVDLEFDYSLGAGTAIADTLTITSSATNGDVTASLGPVDVSTVPLAADYQWNFDDVSGSSIVAYTGSQTGTFLGGDDISVVASTTDCYEGSGCYDLSQATAGAQSRAILNLPLAAYSDGTLTMQGAFKMPTGETVSDSPRLFGKGSTLLATFASNTSMTIYYGGTNLGTYTIDEIATGEWTVIRVVFDSTNTDTVRIYQGVSEDTLVLKDSGSTALGTTYDADPTAVSWYGTNVLAQCLSENDVVVDQVKIWSGAELP